MVVTSHLLSSVDMGILLIPSFPSLSPESREAVGKAHRHCLELCEWSHTVHSHEDFIIRQSRVSKAQNSKADLVFIDGQQNDTEVKIKKKKKDCVQRAAASVLQIQHGTTPMVYVKQCAVVSAKLFCCSLPNHPIISV